jgi:hypothetical protein
VPKSVLARLTSCETGRNTMTQALSWLGIVQNNGKLPDNMRREIAGVIARLAGKNVNISIKEAAKRRSVNQNAFWFKILSDYVTPVFREAGSDWDTWQVHEHLMMELGYKHILITPNGEPKEFRMHSSLMGKKEFSEMVERAFAYLAMEHGIIIPEHEKDIHGSKETN